VVGASGLIGGKVVDRLVAAGYRVVRASRSTGVDVLTGDGLAEALSGADVVVDVTDPRIVVTDPRARYFGAHLE
jgi:uncharacterized protein YbjT (DUF2867 family)